MVIEVEKEKVFVPTWNGNAELPESEQIRVTHRFPKAGERKKYIYTKNVQISSGGEMRDLEYVQDEEGLVRLLVTKITGLEIKTGKKSVKVESGADLYETPCVPQALVSEIEQRILRATPEVDADFLSCASPST